MIPLLAFSGSNQMANRVIKTVLQNGSKSFILHVYLESDGNEGELVNYPLIDPTVDYPELDNSRHIRPVVRQIWHSFSWFDGLLAFDDLVPAPSWNLARDGDNYTDLRYFGGLKDRYIDPKDQKASDRTGRVLLTTNDFAPQGSIGTIILELWKGKD